MSSLEKSPVEIIAPAKRVANLPAYLFADADRQIAAKRAAGVDVIDLGIGDPDIPTPATVIDALKSAAEVASNHRYPNYYGQPEFRQAAAGWYRQRFGVELDPNKEVLSLIGSKEGIAHMSWAFIDPGDVALVPDPGYPVYGISTMLAGGTPHLMPLLPENGFLPNLDAIPPEVLERAKLMWLCYPNNPTSAIAPPEFFHKVVEFAHRHHLLVCHDNAYSDVCYDGYRAPSFLEFPGAREVGVEFHSMSKTYNMTGWRIGMVVGNASAVSTLGRLKTNLDSGVFKAVQAAAVAALTGDQSWLADRNMVYQRRRDLVLSGLRELGIEAATPRASLYVWARIPGGSEAFAFSLKVLDQVGVWVTPGIGFGPSGEGFFRISLTCPDERLKEAVERLRSLDLRK